jgi:O-methyltransferase
MSPLEYAQQIAYSTKETLKFSYDMSVKYKDTPGVYVECGVAAGAQVIAMAYGAPNKTIYAFDSFQGIPLPSCMDDQYPGIRMISDEERRLLPGPGEQLLETTGATSVSLEDFKNHCLISGVGTRNIKPVRGWFEETVINFSREKIAILRLDGDLYNSTAVCLKHLYPKVIDGGMVIIDDYQLRGCRMAVQDFLEDHPQIPALTITPDGIAYFIK